MPTCIAAVVEKLSRFDAYLIHRSEVRAAKRQADEDRRAAEKQAEEDRRAREERWKELKRPAMRRTPRNQNDVHNPDEIGEVPAPQRFHDEPQAIEDSQTEEAHNELHRIATNKSRKSVIFRKEKTPPVPALPPTSSLSLKLVPSAAEWHRLGE